MKVYEWVHEYEYDGKKETTHHAIAVKHICSVYVARWSYDCADASQYSLEIQTKERCWQRTFITKEAAMAQYEYLVLLMEKYDR